MLLRMFYLPSAALKLNKVEQAASKKRGTFPFQSGVIWKMERKLWQFLKGENAMFCGSEQLG